jgi:cell fate regulator YaaT (PSP1 superfamily)
MSDFGVSFERVPLMSDNTSVISVAKNSIFHKKVRHIERRHHLLRDHVEKGDIEMRYIDTERQLADIFTKLLDSFRFADLRGKIGIRHPYSLV